MSKALWLSIAILLCSALEAEALICHKCRRYKVGFGCATKKPSAPCIAKPGQKCKLVETFLEGTIKGIFKQGCTKSTDECDQHVFNPTVGPVKTTCCDKCDFCNTVSQHRPSNVSQQHPKFTT